MSTSNSPLSSSSPSVGVSSFAPAGAAAGTAAGTAAALDPDLLRLLRCPLTKSVLHPQGDYLVADVGGLRYPVRDGIPVMLMEEAALPDGFASLDDLKQSLK